MPTLLNPGMNFGESAARSTALSPKFIPQISTFRKTVQRIDVTRLPKKLLT